MKTNLIRMLPASRATFKDYPTLKRQIQKALWNFWKKDNPSKAEVVEGIEKAPEPDVAEVTTREVPEDDVPPEYLDEDQIVTWSSGSLRRPSLGCGQLIHSVYLVGTANERLRGAAIR